MSDKSSLSGAARVLVVSEDDKVLRLAEAELCDRFSVFTANEVAGALRLLEEEGPFAAVLTDQASRATTIDGILPELVGRHPGTALMLLDATSTRAPHGVTVH
ncbi:hypothetical protein CKO38_18440 [Rhodospirillum rubrum]|uniref:hypothetical protein n=1 Tax=Rhodospirillum rubrum TaxID=1085 RepID=UPI001902F94D|nr:hypothetical protein [Rhodospirillum rubrum]MBK1666401.1 hypothetical protein [Rhodospirillum rubrum]MBK1678594.1 hypothetical protein [Rhodospirillum rubrum]